MDKAWWDRWAPASGILFVALFVLGFLVAGDTPGSGASAEEITTYYLDDRGMLLTAGVTFGLGLIAFLWFTGTVANKLRESGEGRMAATVVASGGTLAGIALFGGIVQAGLAFSIAEQGDAGVVRALNELVWVAQVVISFPAAAFAASGSAGLLRARLVPDWFGWAGIAGAVVLALGGTVWARDGFWAPDGAFTYITLMVFLVWVLAAGALLLRETSAAEVRPAAAT